MEEFLLGRPSQLRDSPLAIESTQVTYHVAHEVVAVVRGFVRTPRLPILSLQGTILVQNGLLDLLDSSDGACDANRSTSSIVAKLEPLLEASELLFQGLESLVFHLYFAHLNPNVAEL